MPTIEEVRERLQLYRTAEKAILENNQSYQIGSQVYNKANIMFVQRKIDELEQQLFVLEGGGSAGCHSVVFGGRR